jgi:Cof subfamily protein (haloacid dehalogenase superfamily)
MRRPRLVATDIDGTLLRHDFTVSDRTRRALRLARDDGALVTLVTGRPPRWTHDLVEETGVDGPVVCANGALTYDTKKRAILDHKPLSPDVARIIIEALRVELPGVEFAFEMGLTFGRERRWAPLHPPPDEVVVEDGLELARRPLTKLLARHSQADAARLAQVALAAVGSRAEATWSTDSLLEVSGAGVTKASALATLAGRLGIASAETIAFGNMPNDLAMLEWAGVGFAVANAHPDVLSAADAVTASNADDGVALVLEQLFATDAV